MTHNLEANKQNAIEFYRTAYLGEPAAAVDRYVGAEYIQHNPVVGDGKYGTNATEKDHGVWGAQLGGDISRKLHLHARSIDIPHPDGHIIHIGNDNITDVIQCFGLTGHTHQPLGTVVFDKARTYIPIVGFDGFNHILLRNTIGQ